MDYVNAETFEYQSSQFYIEQIERLIKVANTNKKVEAWAPAIVSFFSGRKIESNSEEQPLHSAVHLHAIFFAKDGDILRKYFIDNYDNIINWIENLYFYFRSVDAYSILAKELLTINRLLELLEFLENKVAYCDAIRYKFLIAYIQILPYSIRINENRISDKCLIKLNKKYRGLNVYQTSNLMSFRILKSNKGNRSYYEALKWLKIFILENSLSDNISVINAIYVEDKEYFLSNFKILKTRIAETIIKTGSDNSFKGLIYNLVSDNLNYLVQEIYYFLNFKDEEYKFIENHKLIIANGADFIFYFNNKVLILNNQYQRYRSLIGSQNESLNSYTSLAFDEVKIKEDIDYTRYHVADHKLLEFISNMISCYRINEIDYSQFESVTFLPIDTHPLQACITLKEKRIPPLLNISFDGKKVSLQNNKLLCFLTKNSQTYDSELNFINSLDYEKTIFTDPTREQFLHILNTVDYDILYISAHGEYEHFNSIYEEIVFGNEEEGFFKISSDDIESNISTKLDKKILILNICDGANSGLSYLVANRGIANKFTVKGHVVLSYLWPVEPKYAVVFSSLILYQLKEKSINQAYFDVLTLLNTTNEEIYTILVSDEKTQIWANLVLYFSGFNSDSHFYSSAIYT